VLEQDRGYRSAEFVRIKDGDTFVAQVITWKVRDECELSQRSIRVRGWSAKELSEDEGPAMRDEFRRMLQNAQLIELRATGRSFERIVCEVYLDGILFSGLLKKSLRRLRIKRARQKRRG
jgi:hypothetical protein